MYLDFINGPFLPHNLIPAQGSPVPCLSSRWQPDLNFNVLWVPEKEPRYTYSFSLKIPVNEPSLGSPTGLLLRELPVDRVIFI
jgi:hypothetical protein